MQTGKLGVFCSVGDEIRCFENEQGCRCQECTVSSDYSSKQYITAKMDLQRCNQDSFLF